MSGKSYIIDSLKMVPLHSSSYNCLKSEAEVLINKPINMLKDVHRRQKLTTDFFKLCQLTILLVNISILRKKNMLTVVSRRG